jgi:two-component system, cell cycle sensor histidine kinase and response regulator CckA
MEDKTKREIELEKRINELENQLDKQKDINLFNHMTSGCSIWKSIINENEIINFELTDYNRAGELMDCLKKEDLIGKTINDLFPDAVENLSVIATFKDIINTGNSYKFPRNEYLANNEKVIRDNLAFKISDNQIAVIFDDVTKKAKLEEKLQNEYQRLENIIEFLPDPTFVIDKEKKVVAWNKAIEEITNLPKEKVLGKGNNIYSIPFWGEPRQVLIDIIMDNDEKIFKKYDQIKKINDCLTAETYLPNIYNGKGMYAWLRASPLFNNKGKIIGAIESIRDITNQKTSEKKLIESEEKYRMVIDNSREGIIIAQDGVVKWANKKFLEKMEYTIEELQSNSFLDFIHPDSQEMIIKNYSKRINGEKGAEEYQVKAISKNKNIIDVIVKSKEIQYEGNSAILGFFEDITEKIIKEKEKNQLEEKLIHAQKMESIGILAGGIAHDFNNILSGMIGYTELCILKINEDNVINSYLEKVIKNGKRAADLVKQILTFSRKVEVKKENLNLNKIVNESYDLLRNSTSTMINISINIDSNLNYILADYGQMEQIIMNLATNSTQALPDEGIDGLIKIETQNIKISNDSIKKYLDIIPGDYVKLSITDNGLGIHKKDIKYIFEPYFTTKEIGKGTGLGLAIIHGIVKNHDAYINVESITATMENDKIIKQGMTKFEILFPCSDKGKLETITTNYDKSIKGNETILVVDDEEAILEINNQILTKFGYNVITATRGEEAEDIYKNNENNIDLVLLDLNMPGKGGLKSLHSLKKYDPKIKVIIGSGFTTKSIPLADGCIDKPYLPTEMVKKIRYVLDK